MIVDSLRIGGAERIAVELASALDRERFRPFFVVTRDTGPLETTLREAAVEFTLLGRKRGFSPAKYRRAHRLVQRADIIHSHKYGSNMWAALLARTTAKALVVREPTFNGVRTVRRTYGYRSWIAPVARRVICPSSIVAESLYADGVPPSLVEVIPNGVQVDLALPRLEARAELGLGTDDFVVGIIAQLRLEKAHEVLLSAVARLQAEARTLKLCVIGDGPRLPHLLKLAASLGVNGSVVWAGERPDARRLASAFDVGVICSDWEGLPVASLELMAAGVPLISTAVGVLPEILADDVGIVVGVRDVQGLASAIADLMDGPGRAALLAARGRERVRERYSFERMVREFERVYTEVLEEPARGPRSRSLVGGRRAGRGV
jgi:glycosyltransferase involved in cell wall biosynthesis